MRYTVISKNDPDTLSEAVTQLLAEGWRLHDGLSVISYIDPFNKVIVKYTQALLFGVPSEPRGPYN